MRRDQEDILGGAECAGDETGVVGEVVCEEMVEEQRREEEDDEGGEGERCGSSPDALD